MLEDVELTTIGSYGVSGVVWHGTILKNYVEHASCHVTNNVFSQRKSEHNQHLATCRMRGIPIVNVQGRLVQWVPCACRILNPSILTASAR